MDSITLPTAQIVAPRQQIAPQHVRSEWADVRPSLDHVALQARALIASLRDIPRPLFANERQVSDKARVAFAEQIVNGLDDLMGDLVGPVQGRADDARLIGDSFVIDLTDLHTEYAALVRESNQVCVTGRTA